MYVDKVPAQGLGIAIPVIVAIVSAIAGGAQQAYAGHQAGKARRSAEELQRRALEEAERERQERRKYVIAGAIGLAFLVLTLRR